MEEVINEVVENINNSKTTKNRTIKNVKNSENSSQSSVSNSSSGLSFSDANTLVKKQVSTIEKSLKEKIKTSSKESIDSIKEISSDLSMAKGDIATAKGKFEGVKGLVDATTPILESLQEVAFQVPTLEKITQVVAKDINITNSLLIDINSSIYADLNESNISTYKSIDSTNSLVIDMNSSIYADLNESNIGTYESINLLSDYVDYSDSIVSDKLNELNKSLVVTVNETDGYIKELSITHDKDDEDKNSKIDSIGTKQEEDTLVLLVKIDALTTLLDESVTRLDNDISSYPTYEITDITELIKDIIIDNQDVDLGVEQGEVYPTRFILRTMAYSNGTIYVRIVGVFSNYWKDKEVQLDLSPFLSQIIYARISSNSTRSTSLSTVGFNDTTLFINRLDTLSGNTPISLTIEALR